uniref:Uncharacterized protein n=1 Tax=Caenorhabditis tropicalis TaxID=1561998 RepID=A0A1I7V4T0_9PELO
MASVSFCTLLFLVVVVVETVTEVLYQKYFGEGKKRNFELEQDPEPPRGKLKEQMSPSPATPLLPQSSLKVQSTQPSPKSSSRPPLSEIPLESSLKVDKTQEDDPEETAKKPSEMELASTQKGEDDSENVPIPPKPEWKTTKTGRVKRTSMNYEESTYSDLQ